MSHGFPEMVFQTTRHEVILHCFQEVTPERQVISHDQAARSTTLNAFQLFCL